jgi:hypothetical protein
MIYIYTNIIIELPSNSPTTTTPSSIDRFFPIRGTKRTISEISSFNDAYTFQELKSRIINFIIQNNLSFNTIASSSFKELLTLFRRYITIYSLIISTTN